MKTSNTVQNMKPMHLNPKDLLSKPVFTILHTLHSLASFLIHSGCCRIKIQSGRENSTGWGMTGGGEGVCRHASWLCGCSCSANSGAATCWAQMPSSVWKPLASIGNQRSVTLVTAETQKVLSVCTLPRMHHIKLSPSLPLPQWLSGLL